MDTNEMKLNQVNNELTCGHGLQRAHHQAIIDLAFDPLYERLMFLCVLGHMHQQLSKCVATDRERVDKQWSGHEALTLEQLQQLLAVIQTPARPQECLHLV